MADDAMNGNLEGSRQRLHCDIGEIEGPTGIRKWIDCGTPSPPVELLYESASDNDLASLAREGEDQAFEAIARRYRWLVRAKARSFFLQGAEYEDLVQEGMIGLFKAVRDFRKNGSAFRAFAELCVTRQIITSVKTASRQKHAPLNSARSLEEPRYNGNGDLILGEIVGDCSSQFDTVLLKTEEVRTILKILRRHLSPFEYKALILWLQGFSYGEIGHRIMKHEKSIDNGLWRVKCKIRRLIERGVIRKDLV